MGDMFLSDIRLAFFFAAATFGLALLPVKKKAKCRPSWLL
jgi:hypothetical protein